MPISSHRLRIEEKKAYRKLLFSLIFFIFLILLIIFAGIPILTKTIVFLTSFRKEETVNISDITLINPPVLNPTFEATNSAVISISGIAEKESTVKIMVNDVETTKLLADKDGNFIVKNIKLQEGDNTIVASTIVQDKESNPSHPLTIVYKKNPPKLDISTPSEGQKFIGENKEITIAGETDAGNKVTINDRFVIVNQDGKFYYKVTLKDGDNSFKIVATDIAGNQTIVERRVNYSP